MLTADALRAARSESLREDPEVRELFYGALNIFMDNPCELVHHNQDGEQIIISFKEVVYQHVGFTSHPEHIELMIAAELWQMINNQLLLWTSIEVESPPFKDKQVAENQAVLHSLVNASAQIDQLFIQADFWGGNNGKDGVIKTSRPLLYGEKLAEPKSFNGVSRLEPAYLGNRTYFPLEVGYISPSRIMATLFQSGGIARWPYGSPFIYFLEMEKKHFQESLELRLDN